MATNVRWMALAGDLSIGATMSIGQRWGNTEPDKPGEARLKEWPAIIQLAAATARPPHH